MRGALLDFFGHISSETSALLNSGFEKAGYSCSRRCGPAHQLEPSRNTPSSVQKRGGVPTASVNGK